MMGQKEKAGNLSPQLCFFIDTVQEQFQIHLYGRNDFFPLLLLEIGITLLPVTSYLAL